MTSKYTPGTVINDRYVIVKLLSCGGKGFVYSAMDKSGDSQREVAIKIFLKTVTDNCIPDTLSHEYNVMKALEEEPGFPRAYDVGLHDQHPYLVMERLGIDFFDLQKRCTNLRFTAQTMLQIVDQILQRLKALHDKGYIHGDLKSDNMSLGLGTQDNVIYLIDFGLSVPYRDLQTGEHYPFRSCQKVGGTVYYNSRHAHHKFQQSRRDDMESLSYVLASMANEDGFLPWNTDCNKLQNHDVTMKEHAAIADKKDKATAAELFPGMPPEFGTFHQIVKNLRFDEEPKYTDLRSMFQRAGRRFGVNYGEKMRFE